MRVESWRALQTTDKYRIKSRRFDLEQKHQLQQSFRIVNVIIISLEIWIIRSLWATHASNDLKMKMRVEATNDEQEKKKNITLSILDVCGIN